MKVLDLYCGAGGCSRGYADAGYQVVGVDTNAAVLKNYPYDSIRADARDVLVEPSLFEGYDLIHASPPCQAYSVTRHTHGAGDGSDHPDLLGPTLELLTDIHLGYGIPWVVENVPGAPLDPALVLCGTMFGLQARDTDGRLVSLRRHRLFASPYPLEAPAACTCFRVRQLANRNLRPTRTSDRVGGVYGGGSNDNNYAAKVRRGGYTPGKPIWEHLMGIDWMTRDQLTQAIPPIYTRWIGTVLRPHLESRTG